MLKEKRRILFGFQFPLIIKWTEFPAFLGFCSFSAGIIIFQLISPSKFLARFDVFLIVLSFFCVIIGILISKKAIRVLLFFISGFTFANLEYINNQRINLYTKKFSDRPYIICGEIISNPSPTKENFSFNFKIEKIDTISKSPLYGRIVKILTKDNIQLKMGNICIKGHLYSSEEEYLKEILNRYSYFKPYTIDAVIFVDSLISYNPKSIFPTKLAIQIREKVYRIIGQYNKPEHRALIRAVFLAEKGYIVPEVKDAFFKSGLSHLLALSGLHAGILLTAIYLMLYFFPISKALKHISAIIVLWGYLFFVGFIPSLTRATVMCTLVILTLLFEKKNYSLQSLGLAGLIWLIFSPSSLFDIGFQLSYTSTGGILSLYPILSESLSYKFNSRLKILLKKFFITPLLISLSALITTIPLLLYHFRGFSLYGIFGNIFATLLMSCAMWLFFGAILIDTIFPLFTSLTLFCSSLFLDALIFIAEGATKIPFSYCKVEFWQPEFIIFYYVILVGIITIVKEKRIIFTCVALPLFFTSLPLYYLLLNLFPEPILTYITNSLFSSTTTIIWPDRRVWLIGSGEESKILKSLSQNFIPYINHIPNSRMERIIIVSPENCLTDSILGRNRIVVDKIKYLRTTRKSFSTTVDISLDSTGTIISIATNSGKVRIKTNGKYLLLYDKTKSSYSKIHPNKVKIPALLFFSRKGIKFKNLKEDI
ncbi:MAG: competence protein ComEC family protein [Chitinispirillaceae bacterium]|nr:competence protein ComEC family protein [Chitinispirillaceae bacterium]